MAYKSVDELQRMLTKDVFHYAKDSKKAAGRALGTLVETITYHILKTWNFKDYVAIERGIQEFGNAEIRHNVEYSLHPALLSKTITIHNPPLPLTAAKLLRWVPDELKNGLAPRTKSAPVLLTKDHLLRNACVIGSYEDSVLTVNVHGFDNDTLAVRLVRQHNKPFAIFECKRVGIEEGNRKGPQTIEKAKQGAYVARTVSSLQKIRTAHGQLHGIIFNKDHTLRTAPYEELLTEMVASRDPAMLRDFVLTVGVVSNHGNWFTSDNQNKEMKVLAQSYDWLLFLTDEGLAEFIQDVLRSSKPLFKPVYEAFRQSYCADKKTNRFTKVRMDFAACKVLDRYFVSNEDRIKKWFNVISPPSGKIVQLSADLHALAAKDWKGILQ